MRKRGTQTMGCPRKNPTQKGKYCPLENCFPWKTALWNTASLGKLPPQETRNPPGNIPPAESYLFFTDPYMSNAFKYKTFIFLCFLLCIDLLKYQNERAYTVISQVEETLYSHVSRFVPYLCSEQTEVRFSIVAPRFTCL